MVCSSEVRLVDEVQAKLLRVFRPLARLPAEYEVGLRGKLPSLKQKLLEDKVGCAFS